MSFSVTRTVIAQPNMSDLQEALLADGTFANVLDFITNTGDEYIFTKTTAWTVIDEAQLDIVILALLEIPIGKGLPLGVASGRWIDNSAGSIAETTTPEILTGNVVWAAVFSCKDFLTFDKISIEITGAGSIGGEGRLAVYEPDGSGEPGELVAEASDVFATGTVGVKELPISIRLHPGYYFIAIVHDSPAPISVLAYSAIGAPLFLGWPSSSIINCQLVLSAAMSYGALPLVFPGTRSYSTLCPPRFSLRIV